MKPNYVHSKPGSTKAYAVPISALAVKTGRKSLPKKTKPAPIKQPTLELGDLVESALRTVGITTERVTKWIGRPCGCERRKQMLNQLSRWAKRVLSGETEDAEKYLEEIVSE